MREWACGIARSVAVGQGPGPGFIESMHICGAEMRKLRAKRVVSGSSPTCEIQCMQATQDQSSTDITDCNAVVSSPMYLQMVKVNICNKLSLWPRSGVLAFAACLCFPGSIK